MAQKIIYFFPALLFNMLTLLIRHGFNVIFKTLDLIQALCHKINLVLIPKHYKSRHKIESWLDYHEIENYTIHENLTVSVNGSVRLSGKKIYYIPVRFSVVRDVFSIHMCHLKSLKGVPHTVGTFVCSHNDLTTLEYAPVKVRDNFQVRGNKLTSLKHMPEVSGDIDIAWNCLQSLDYLTRAHASLDISGNAIETLSNLPKKLNGNLDISHNRLKSLQGSPIWVSGNFDCARNRLTSLEYLSAHIGGNLICGENHLTELDFLPASLMSGNNPEGGNIICEDTNLQSFKGIKHGFRGILRHSCEPGHEVPPFQSSYTEGEVDMYDPMLMEFVIDWHGLQKILMAETLLSDKNMSGKKPVEKKPKI